MLEYHSIGEILKELKDYNWIKSTDNKSSARLYYWTHKANQRNLLLLPSAAGIYTKYTDSLNFIQNKYRFDFYYDICKYLSSKFNIFLVSFSGQAHSKILNPECKEYSLDQASNDIKLFINEYIEPNYGSISGTIGICTGASVFAHFMDQDPKQNLPKLFVWDSPAIVGWDNYKLFDKLFPSILYNKDTCKYSPEPINILPKYRDSIFYAYPLNNHNSIYCDYESMVSLIQKNSANKIKCYQDIGHVPSKYQSRDSFNELTSDIIDWFK